MKQQLRSNELLIAELLLFVVPDYVLLAITN